MDIGRRTHGLTAEQTSQHGRLEQLWRLSDSRGVN